MGNCCAPEALAADVEGEVTTGLLRKPVEEKVPRGPAAVRKAPKIIDWSDTDPSKWSYKTTTYNGSYTFTKQPELTKVTGSISEGIERLKANPGEFDGVFYQTSMMDWPKDQQKYTTVRRTGSGFKVLVKEAGAAFTFVEAVFKSLPSEVKIEADAFTDAACCRDKPCGEPLCPGRGHGIADVPTLTIVRDVDPSDMTQGKVGDCWLLSAISALAEYDGAIKHLFRKTQGLDAMPRESANLYTVTLWDVPTQKEVDIVIDERLCTGNDGKGLIGCQPTADGELWPCYLEKAVAAHCGGWDKIDGGTCSQAFRLLVGAQEQYTFKSDGKGGWNCFGGYNPNEKRWEQFGNSPHDGFKGLWPMAWPQVGGGGKLGQVVPDAKMYDRMCLWEDVDFILCCGTKAGSDSQSTDGIVDGHAYTILTLVEDAAGTGINMIKVRNPWGRGEITSGKWDDDGPGWDQYPQIKELLEPVQANDGVFWLEMDEFFKYFKTVYLCAKSMREFLED